MNKRDLYNSVSCSRTITGQLISTVYLKLYRLFRFFSFRRLLRGANQITRVVSNFAFSQSFPSPRRGIVADHSFGKRHFPSFFGRSVVRHSAPDSRTTSSSDLSVNHRSICPRAEKNPTNFGLATDFIDICCCGDFLL